MGRGASRGPQRGADLRYTLQISFEEAIFGTEKEINFRRLETCTVCRGSGAEPGTDPVRCPITDAAVDCGSGQLAAVTSGNPFIDAETSDSYTLGAVWEPVRGASIGIDYWNFKVTNQITASVPQAVIDNPGGFPAAQLNRNPNDELPGIPNSGTILSLSLIHI